VVVDTGAVRVDVTVVGEAEGAAAAFFFFSHECLPGDGEATALGEPVAVATDFFECLCFEGLGEAPGVGLDVAVWARIVETENTVSAMRGMSFFMAMIYQQQRQGCKWEMRRFPIFNLLVRDRQRATFTYTMDELINVVVQKTGISQDDAQKAVQVVVDALKARLPAPIAAQVDAFLTSGASGGVNALETEAETAVKNELGGFLGKL